MTGCICWMDVQSKDCPVHGAGHDWVAVTEALRDRIERLESRLWQYEELARNTSKDTWARECHRKAADALLALGEMGKWHDQVCD